MCIVPSCCASHQFSNSKSIHRITDNVKSYQVVWESKHLKKHFKGEVTECSNLQPISFKLGFLKLDIFIIQLMRFTNVHGVKKFLMFVRFHCTFYYHHSYDASLQDELAEDAIAKINQVVRSGSDFLTSDDLGSGFGSELNDQSTEPDTTGNSGTDNSESFDNASWVNRFRRTSDANKRKSQGQTNYSQRNEVSIWRFVINVLLLKKWFLAIQMYFGESNYVNKQLISQLHRA